MKVNEKDTIVRIATSWATDEEDARRLIELF